MRASFKTAIWTWDKVNIQATGDATNLTVVDPAASARLFIYRIEASLSATGTVTVSEGNNAVGTNLMDEYLLANTKSRVEWPFEAPFACAADSILRVTTTGTTNLKLVVYYREI